MFVEISKTYQFFGAMIAVPVHTTPVVRHHDGIFSATSRCKVVMVASKLHIIDCLTTQGKLCMYLLKLEASRIAVVCGTFAVIMMMTTIDFTR